MSDGVLFGRLVNNLLDHNECLQAKLRARGKCIRQACDSTAKMKQQIKRLRIRIHQLRAVAAKRRTAILGFLEWENGNNRQRSGLEKEWLEQTERLAEAAEAAQAEGAKP